MPNWTKEQQEAIDKEGCNIIVSAGAGSGKTAVLTERVIRKLKSGININEILVLTFTNAAAFEMKERIRKAIKKEENLKDQLDLIDGSYITTFDSFSLSIVKKYHYLLNISKDVSIIDSSIIYNEKVKILDDIMNEYYEKNDSNFIKMIHDFCIKDDDEIKKNILNINDKMDLLMDKDKYLDNYLDNYYNDSFIDEKISLYLERVNNKFENIKNLGRDLLSLSEGNFYDKLNSLLIKMDSTSSYKDICLVLKEKIPSLPKGSEEEVKDLKERFSDLVKSLSKELEFSSKEEMKETILLTRTYAEVIIAIIKELNNRLDKFKYANNSFEFNDIAHLAIKIVRDNRDVCQELKYSFKEIMIDEYQDTSNIQETFINLIENNNVYMVGDIKQSIYRFRNADCYIFKNKYDNYSKNIGGYKIDLVKNFRSRGEVLDNINLIFDSIMDSEIGGADYRQSHRMVFGNNSYLEEGKTNQNYDMELYNYNYDNKLGYTKDEIEIFTIVRDIKEKIDSHYQIFDKDVKVLRDVTYNDFCILLDRAKSFDLYKKIFEYFEIPLTKYTSTNITRDDDISLIKNILTLIICLKENDYNSAFKHSFTSLARSYLFSYGDEEIFDYLKNNTYKDSDLYQKIKIIEDESSYLALSKVIEKIIDEFSFYIKSVNVGDMEKVGIRLEYILNLALSMEGTGYGIKEFRDYLDNLIKADLKMECEISENISDSVKIMTIHKSKGLEFPICYFAGLSYAFNTSDINDKFLYTSDYGIICPFIDSGIGSTIYRNMFKDDYLLEEIGERIRLFYVAITRAKEKMIFVCSLKDENNFDSLIVPTNIRSKYKSFSDILNSISSILIDYKKDIDINNLNLTHDYNLIKKTNYQDRIEKDDTEIINKTLSIDNDININKHYSKSTNEIISKDKKEIMSIGTKVHYLFEMIDLNNPDYSKVEDKYQKYIKTFLNCGIDFNTKIYKEYEFIYEKDNVTNHGIIDLMLEYDDEVKIIDYKLSNTEDDAYLDQLHGYQDYIASKTKKKVSIYLYSIIKGELKCL